MAPEATMESDGADSPYNPTKNLKPAPDLPQTISKLQNRLPLCTSVGQIMQEAAKFINAIERNKFLIKTAEDVLSYMFQIDQENSNDGVKNVSFHFLWTI